MSSPQQPAPAARRPEGQAKRAEPADWARIDAADVRAAYRMFLGRPPENERVVEGHLAAAPDLAALRERFLRSKEFLKSAYQPIVSATIRRAANFEPNRMEIDVAPQQLERLFAHVQRVWSRLGEREPHYSVISDPRYRPASLDGHVESFRRSGLAEAEALRRRLAALGLEDLRPLCCAEYGCGVGRVTAPLARLFGRVVGYDISAPHLGLAAETLAAEGARNVSLVQVRDLRNLRIEPHDVLYSRIVLQHNPPPLIAFVLRKVLGAVKPGGMAIFQLLTHIEGYSFAVEPYLAGADRIDDQELHALRQDAVFAILHECGFVPLHVVRDHSVSGLDRVSMQFVARRLAGAP